MAEAANISSPSALPNPSLPEHLRYKSRLQEYAQRSAIPHPFYQTINEGFAHEPKFRATVYVDGQSFTSPRTFSHIKEAKQDAAKFALDRISQKIRDGGCPYIREDTTFCKSILNEFSVKMNMEMPTYTTNKLEGLLPLFTSSLVFNGKTYAGEAGRNKKEAEQLAARVVINSVLGSGSGTLMSEIIKSKAKLYAALHVNKPPGSAHETEVLVEVSERGFNKSPIIACPEAPLGLISNEPVAQQPFKKPKVEVSTETGTGYQSLNASQAGCGPVLDAQLSQHNQFKEGYNCPDTTDTRVMGKKRSRKNKKGKKKMRSGQLQMANVPINTAASCSISH